MLGCSSNTLPKGCGTPHLWPLGLLHCPHDDALACLSLPHWCMNTPQHGRATGRGRETNKTLLTAKKPEEMT